MKKLYTGLAIIGLVAIMLTVSLVALATTDRLGATYAPTFSPNKILTKTTTYQVLTTDQGALINCNATGGSFTVTLPASGDINALGYSFPLKFVKTDATTGVVTIAPSTGDTIGGESARKILFQSGIVQIHHGPVGNDWVVEFESDYFTQDHEAGTYLTGIGSGGLFSSATASATLTTASCGNIYSLATGTLVMTLPATVANCKLTFINNTTSQQQSIKPNASDAIWGIVESTAGPYSRVTMTQLDGNAIVMTGNSSGPGAVLQLIGDGSVGWIISNSTYSATR